MDSPDEVRRLRARLVADGVELVEDEETEGYVGFKCLDPVRHVVEVAWSLELRGVQVPARSDHERFEDS
jgi:hypothetical protein